MNKTERTELKGVIGRRMKVLRADIETRRRELYITIDEQLDAEYHDELKKYNDVRGLAEAEVLAANRAVNDLWRKHYPDAWPDTADKMLVAAQHPTGPSKERTRERLARRAKVDAIVSAAYTELERKEADLREELATGALESADAKEFMARIPTVGELVPASRLEQLTADASGEEPAR
jgi:hypothetical protein